ncbi:Signal transduction histidine kinase [Lutibacter oricola]|uniref:histidine kinase n=1 Tax=Lutibacter oricola TaxID=762486 RepID=A0A1H3FRA8_9FLAO|nr:tetratricopeptide repeat-containing sensor histidine kinase [Lutibacter oricola]SDX92679.1 Signal transduction histidine kinase [Lutibacter oricola]
MKVKFILLFFFTITVGWSQVEELSKEELKLQYLNEPTDSIKALLGFYLGGHYIDEPNDSATYYYYKSYKLIEHTNNDLLKGSILHNLGYKFEVNNNNKKALEYYIEASHFYQKTADTLSLAQINNNIGYGYMHLYDEDKAIGYYLESMALYKSLGNLDGIAVNLTDIASLYYDYENYEFAIKKYTEALEIYKELNDEAGISGAYTNLGNAVSDNGDCLKGLEYFRKSIEIQQKINDVEGLAINFNNIGDCYIQLKQYKKAISYFEKALVLVQEINDEDLKSIIYLNIADAEVHSKNYKKAIKNAITSLTISEKIGNVDYSLENCKTLAKSYQSIGNKDLALKYLNRYRVLNDSLLAKDKLKKVKLFNAYHQIEASEYQIKSLEDKNKITEVKYATEKKIINFLVGSMTVFAILLFIVITQQTSKKKAYNLLSFKNYQIEKMNYEIQEQRDNLVQLNIDKDRFFSIIAHDLKNPFSSIIGFTELMIENIGEYDYEKQLKFLKIIKGSSTRASNLLNNLLIWANSQSGKLAYEPKKIELFDLASEVITLLEIQAINKDINILNLIEYGTTVTADSNMLDTIIRNLLSNAIKFTNNFGVIEITAKKKKKFIHISVKDNGAGMSKEVVKNLFLIDKKKTVIGSASTEQGSGLGLILCKEFVEKHGGEIGVESKLGKGSTFTFTIPRT